MKRLVLVSAAVFALGLGFGASAYAEAENDCYTTCQEIMNDCLAQTGNFLLCKRAYRECLAGCG